MSELAALPARPPSVTEWEDLLVRLEIMPRALRNTVDDAGPGGEALREVMWRLMEREAAVGRWLETASGVGSPEASGAAPDADALSLYRRFASLRARNFAMLQRRGLVWEWAGEWEGEHATVYQLLAWLLGRDGEALDAARRAAAGAAAC